MVELKNPSFGSVGAPAVEKKEEKTPFDLRSLIETGIIKKEIVIGDTKFVLKSPSMSERKELATVARKIIQENSDQAVLDPEKAFELNVITLTYSIHSANGTLIEDLYPEQENSKISILQKKKEIIEAMQFHVLAELISFYNEEILLPSEQKIDPGEVKN